MGRADKMADRIRDDQRDPYRRDITEYTPDWKDRQIDLEDYLMRAKVQFINGDLTGATETYRAIDRLDFQIIWRQKICLNVFQ